MSPKKAILWVGFWFLLAMGFAAGLYKWGGEQLGSEFITCYIIEWSLSVDNLFVFLMIFQSLGIESKYQKRTLQWGIIGAVVSRLVFILLGLGLVTLFEPVMYVFGAILIYSAWKMIAEQDEEIDIQEKRSVKWVKKYLPLTSEIEGDRFFVRKATGLVATPLFLALVVIDIFDLIFAIDSIPAAFAISRHPLVIFSANTFAIMGLRSLYFLLEHANRAFRFLKFGVALVLGFVGVKMLIAHYVKIETTLSLILVVGTLALSIVVSLLMPAKMKSVSK